MIKRKLNIYSQSYKTRKISEHPSSSSPYSSRAYGKYSPNFCSRYAFNELSLNPQTYGPKFKFPASIFSSALYLTYAPIRCKPTLCPILALKPCAVWPLLAICPSILHQAPILNIHLELSLNIPTDPRAPLISLIDKPNSAGLKKANKLKSELS